MTRDCEQLYIKPRIRLQNAGLSGLRRQYFWLGFSGLLVLFDDSSGNNLPLVDLCK